jgi:hypothetical protein
MGKGGPIIEPPFAVMLQMRNNHRSKLNERFEA